MTTTNEIPMEIQLPDAPAESPAETAPEDSSGVNWADEAGEMGDLLGEDIVQAVEGDTEILEEKPAVEAPAVVIPAAVPEVPAVIAPVEVPVAPVQQPTVVAPTTPAIPFDQAKWETEQLSGLEKLYAIDPADAEKLQTEPELMLPILAARMHMMVTKSLLTAVQDMIPSYVQNHSQQSSIEVEAKNAFYSVNQDLNDPKFESAIMQVGKIFRAANPTASREEAVKTIGNMVRMSLGMSAPVAASTPTNVVPLNQPSARPFSPARGGGGSPVVKSSNPWDEFTNRDE